MSNPLEDWVPAELLRDRGLVDGVWTAADDGAEFEVTNPATGDVLARVPDMGARETSAAIEAAERAQRLWAARTAGERAEVLFRWRDLVLEHQDALARLLTLEQGKPVAEARGEIGYAASFLRFYGEEARRIRGETIPSASADTRIVVLRQPIGVAACITPWNFPAAMITRKAAPAIAAGCAVVMKPAELTPLSALALAALAEQAGMPAGVLNIVTGQPQAIGAELCASPAVRALSFTGSTDVGRLLSAQCAPTVKKLSLELGGNAPFIVFDDADLDAAVEGAVLSKYRHSGQTCVCTNRFLVQDGIYDEFTERFTSRVAALTVGDGMVDGVQVGPLINERALDKVQAHVADALDNGAKLLTGGEHLGGTFYAPTVLGEATTDMRLASEETFGPVAALFRFGAEAEAIQLANDTEYGLGGYFYTRDVGRVWRVAEQLETGMVGINSAMLSVEIAPFGGVKQSGIGREGSHHGIDEFVELKYLAFGGIR
ncbi:NAD-dependent succinate-semialdehyde dehydrogenase [Allokutzneria sp. NRRL B-24872]|uniref:NAD-dependent succinate-semialdehyde dehydrogenase n=1 Tax=Allokutzneria sp. NRRL B-24872 TaxID=1137961 RepID=UPI000A3C1BB6|nr:NAD-dependent succinate-semialdehyde dehydrogenase [Allokutzneria sp. NRRL B-24872]